MESGEMEWVKGRKGINCSNSGADHLVNTRLLEGMFFKLHTQPWEVLKSSTSQGRQSDVYASLRANIYVTVNTCKLGVQSHPSPVPCSLWIYAQWFTSPNLAPEILVEPISKYEREKVTRNLHEDRQRSFHMFNTCNKMQGGKDRKRGRLGQNLLTVSASIYRLTHSMTEN